MSAPHERTCPECGKESLKRLVGAGAGILFKGTGFYETDYRSDSYKKGAESEKKSKESEKKSKESDSSSASTSSDAPKSGKSDSSPESSPASNDPSE